MIENIGAGCAPLVGRDRVRARIAQHLANVRDGHGTVVMLSGAPGIGKTRLLDEIASPEFARDATVLRGCASQAEGMPPYLPFLEVLGGYVMSAPVEVLREQVGIRAATLATILPEIPERLGSLDPARPLPPEQERFRLYEAVAVFLATIATREPLLLLFDDLQWADAATCDLLVHVSRRLRSVRQLIVGAYREGEVGDNPALLHALAELNRYRRLASFEVQPLDAEECRVLSSRLLGGEIGMKTATLLHRHSEGNPFFLEELIRALVDDGTLVFQHGRWESSRRPRTVLPPRVAEAIRSRLVRLDPAVADLLRIAAVVGRIWEPALLARVAEMETERAEVIILDAARAQLVRLHPEGVYGFAHDMVRETLYAEVGRERRRRLHQAIGEALETEDEPASPRRLADLAFHFGQSGERGRGVSYAIAAGRHALEASAAVDAIGHFETALRLPDKDDLGHREEALAGLGAAASLLGDYPRAAEAHEQACEIAWRRGDRTAAARASCQLGRARWRQERAIEAGMAFERALALLGSEDSPGGVEALLALADLHVASLGKHTEGMAYADRALAAIQRLGDRQLEARALCVMGNIKARGNDLVAGRAALERSLALASELDEAAIAAEACAYLANISAWTGEVAQSRELSLRRLTLAQRTHDPFEIRHVYSWVGAMDVMQGRWSEAEWWFSRQEQALEGLQTPEPLATLRANQGTMYYYRGHFEDAERALGEAVAAVRPMGASQLVWYLGRLGLVLAELRPAEALLCFTELHMLADSVDEKSSARLGTFAYLAVGYARLGEKERAAGCYQSLLPFSGQFAPIPADRALGLAAAAAGDSNTARRHLEAAEAQARRSGLRPELALILLERGTLARKPTAAGQRGPGREGTADPVAEGMRLCAELGMQALGQRTLGGDALESPVRVGGLTRRELDVLRLVARGRTNREIATTLFLSEHTVARHLTHIFTKISVENRASAAAYALRNNLA